MKIEVTKKDDGVAVKVAGCLDTVNSAEFKRTADGIPSAKRVTFDFSELEFIASSALRVMVSLAKRLEPTGAVIEVAGANDVVRDVFEMTGLVEVFDFI